MIECEYDTVLPIDNNDPCNYLLLSNCKHLFIRPEHLPIDLQAFVMEKIYNCDKSSWCTKLGIDIQNVRSFSLAIGQLTNKEDIPAGYLGKLSLYNNSLYIDRVQYRVSNTLFNYNHFNIGDTLLLAYINGILVYIFRLTDNLPYDTEENIVNHCVDQLPDNQTAFTNANHDHAIPQQINDLDGNSKTFVMKKYQKELTYTLIGIAVIVLLFIVSVNVQNKLTYGSDAYQHYRSQNAGLFIVASILFFKALDAFSHLYQLKNNSCNQINGVVTDKQNIHTNYYLQLNHLIWISVEATSYFNLNIHDQCMIIFDRKYKDDPKFNEEKYTITKEIIKIN